MKLRGILLAVVAGAMLLGGCASQEFSSTTYQRSVDGMPVTVEELRTFTYHSRLDQTSGDWTTEGYRVEVEPGVWAACDTLSSCDAIVRQHRRNVARTPVLTVPGTTATMTRAPDGTVGH